jgi:ATP-dependent Lon protease
VIRGVAMKIAESPAVVPGAEPKEGEPKTVVVDKVDVAEYLGTDQVLPRHCRAHQLPGVATGLAVTPVGGDILFVEATAMPGKGKLQLTGKLGDVMKESAQGSLSWVRAHSAELNIDPGFFENMDLSLHVPQGAIARMVRRLEPRFCRPLSRCSPGARSVRCGHDR